MTDITLKVEPMVIVKVENDFSQTVQDVFFTPKTLQQLYDDNWSLEIFWFPFNSMGNCEAMLLGLQSFGPVLHCISKRQLKSLTNKWDPLADKVWIRKINIVPEPEEACPTPTEYKFGAAKDLASTTFGRLLSQFLNDHSGCVPSFLKVGFEMVQQFNKETTYEYINKAIHYQSFVEVFPVLDMEFAFNAPEDDFEDLAQAMQDVVTKVEELAHPSCCSRIDPQFPLSVAMEMRWMGSSEALLCPARAASSKDEGGSGESTTTMITIARMTATQTTTKTESTMQNVKPPSPPKKKNFDK